jgi:hypothetical protein
MSRIPNLNQTVIVTLCAILICSSVVPAVGAQEDDSDVPESPEEFLGAFQAMEGMESFEEYSEFEIIRSQAVQDSQVGEFTDSTQQRLSQTFELLRTFDQAVRMQQNESYNNALTLADSTREIAATLRGVEKGEQYAVLADIALDRFYEETAETLLTAAEESENTPNQIKLLEQAAEAYNQAGATERFGQVELRTDETKQQFEADMAEINSTVDAMDGFLNACDNCDNAQTLVTGGPLSVFELYSDSQSVLSAGDTGLSLAEKHSLEEMETELTSDREVVQEYNQNLAVASVSMILGYSVVLGLLVAVITWRLMLWRRDFVQSQNGDIILMGEMLNA